MSFKIVKNETRNEDGRLIQEKITYTYNSWYDDIYTWLSFTILIPHTIFFLLSYMLYHIFILPILWPFWKFFGGKYCIWTDAKTSINSSEER